MRAVPSTGSSAELAVQKILNKIGRAYRVNDPSLPGRPDISLKRGKIAIFVHGCFWHRHRCKRGARTPKSNRDYWLPKLARNLSRDKRVRQELRKVGWRCMVIWECQLREPARIKARLEQVLRASSCPAAPTRRERIR